MIDYYDTMNEVDRKIRGIKVGGKQITANGK
jgi:hypothetical protein